MTAKELLISTRIAKGLEIADVVKLTGFTTTQIRSHESGSNITETTLNIYARAYGAEAVDVRFVFRPKPV